MMTPQLLLALVLALTSEVAHTESKARVANSDYSLSTSEEARLMNLAYAGDAKAAMRLSNRFMDDFSGSRNENVKRAMEWAVIGAENGSSEAEFQAFSLLSSSSDKGKQTRALFWLKRSAQHGNSDAQAILKVCPTVESVSQEGACFGPG
jgi:hypothetical protein